MPVVASDGTLLLFFTQLDATASGNAATLRVMRSPDHGTTWGEPVDVARILSVGARDPQTGTAVRDAAILASVAAGPNGQLAAVWQDARFSGGQRDGIAFSRSVDGGLTWSEPVRLNADPAVQAFVPTVAIRGDGTIAVTYFDFRSDTISAATLLTDYWMATSTDGVIWRERRLAGPFDLALAPNAGGLFLGDYMGLGVAGQAFVPMFVTTEGGQRGEPDRGVGGPGDRCGRRTPRARATKRPRRRGRGPIAPAAGAMESIGIGSVRGGRRCQRHNRDVAAHTRMALARASIPVKRRLARSSRVIGDRRPLIGICAVSGNFTS